jgi:hypothetical protein
MPLLDPSRARRRRRTRVGAVLALAALPVAGLAVAASAQDPAAPQTVTIATAGGKATVTGADALAQGPTRFVVSGTGKEVDLTLFQLKPGATQAQVVAALAKLKGPPTSLQKYGSFAFGSTSGKGYAPTTTDLALTTATYLVVDSTRALKVVSSFAVGTTTTTVATPTPDATITMRDFHITAPATLPSTGTIRVTNTGKSPHFLLALKAGSTAGAHEVAMLLHKGGQANEKKAQKLITGEDELVSVISPGVTNDVEVSRLAKGSYVLVCFYGDARSHMKEHSMLGMETVVHVR